LEKESIIEHPITLAQAAPMTPLPGIKNHPEIPAANTTNAIKDVNRHGLLPACNATYQGVASKVIAQPASSMSKTSTA